LRQDYHKFEEAGVEVLVVGPEKAEAFREFWQKEDLPFTGLPDPKHGVLKLLGQQVNLFKLGRMPAQVWIDREGIVRYAHYGKSMSDIPANDELLQLIAGSTFTAQPEES
jgi:peroxiredoxin